MSASQRSADDVILELEFMLPRVPDGDVETTVATSDIALIVSEYRRLQGLRFDEASGFTPVSPALAAAGAKNVIALEAENGQLKKALSIAVDFAASEKAKVLAMQFEKLGIPVSFPDEHSNPVEKNNTAPGTIDVPVTPTPAMLARMVEVWNDIAEDSKVSDISAMEGVWDAALEAAQERPAA